MSKLIFVCDDDQGILEVTNIILSTEGYMVKTFADYGKLKEALNKSLPDLILLDIWLAGEDGREIFRKIRTNNNTAEIPVLFISALNDTDKIAQEAGADGYITKPFEMDGLLKKVAEYVR